MTKAIHSPMGVWGKKLALTGKNKTETVCSNPGLLEKKEGELFLHITEDIHEPIILEHSGQDANIVLRILAEPSVSATIIEYIKGSITHSLTAGLAKNSNISYGLLQEGVCQSTKRAVLEQDAHMTWFELNQGTVQSRTVTELNEGAQVISNSIFLGAEKDFIDFGSQAIHLEPYSQSQLFTKGALRGAHGIYDGVLDIKKPAQHSSAHQKQDCLLLDDNSEMKAAPQLFIDNNDVQCSHACSTTKPDEALAFYLQSRGVAKDISDAMLIKAFVWPVIEALPQHLACRVETHVEEVLERYGGSDGK